jgi:acylphosphatase
MPGKLIARRFLVKGRVQGVGYRYFVQKAASSLNVSGYARNLVDGSVEVYAFGSEQQLSDLEGILRTGPPFSDVRGVDRKEAAFEHCTGFQIR